MNDSGEFNLMKTPLAGTTLIEASAGTGKTYAITGLVLRLILEQSIPVSEILVVTFTDAATNELKDRIRRRLRDALEYLSGGNSDDEMLEGITRIPGDTAAARRRLSAAVNDFDQASIFTIHGFCARILRDHAFESGVFLDTEMVVEQEGFIREIVHDFWRNHCYQISPLFFNHAVARSFNPSTLHTLAGKSTANPHMKVVPEIQIPCCREVEDDYRDRFANVQGKWLSAREEVKNLLTTADGLNRTKYPKASIPGWIEAMDGYLSLGAHDCHAFDKFERFTASQIRSGVKKGCTPPVHPFFLLSEDLNLARLQLADCFDQRILGLRGQFIETARRELSQRKLNKSLLYYDDLLLLVDRALRGPGAENLAAAVREKFKAALIDEFQDTDSIQYAIFEKIFGGGKGILFLIGDPKQAIYGFRGADIFTYMDAADHTPWRFTLAENWRSEPELTGAVNTIFARANLPFVYGEIPFRPVRPAGNREHDLLSLDGRREPPLQIWFLESDQFSDGKPVSRTTARSVIPQAVAGEISRLLSLARQNRASIGNRRLVEGDIAVLVRRNDEAQWIQQALSELRIHSVLYNVGNLFETRESLEVQRLLTAIADPGDERSLKIALTTDLIGVTGEKLDDLIRDEAAWEQWLIRFGEYHEMWKRYGFFRMFRDAISREGVLPRLMSLVEGERRCTNILHLSEVLHRASIENSSSMLGLLKWLAARRESADPRTEEHQLRLESDENAVKIVTIHKSKGLEYPVVFCPFIGDGSRLRGKDDPFTFHDESDGRILTLDLGSPMRAENAAAAQREQLAENLRLLYVAMTRAKDRCYLVWGRFRDAETSAPAYLFHQPQSGEAVDQAAAAAERYSSLDDEGLWRDLLEIQTQAGGSIELKKMRAEEGTPLPLPELKAAALASRRFHGSINRQWGITSFSSLISTDARSAEWADRDETPSPAPPVEEEPASPSYLDHSPRTIFDFPKGTAAGIFLHDLFENLDFSSQDQTAARDLIEAKLKLHGFAGHWVDSVREMVDRVLHVPLDPLDDRFTFSRIEKADRLHELEFYFPLRHLSEGKLRDVFSRLIGTGQEFFIDHDSGGGSAETSGSFVPTEERPDFHPFRYAHRLDLRPVEGFMKGFMDLVFRFRERFYLVDWKSNYLGGRTEDYNRAALEKAMTEGAYHLQYHLYTVAVHRYLKTRIPDYSYESHFGGVFYVFLRGIDPAKGSDYGIYRCRPAAASVEALCSHLTGWGER